MAEVQYFQTTSTTPPAAAPASTTPLGGGLSTYQNNEDRYASDIGGSFDDWVAATAKAMATRYAQGDASVWQLLTGNTGAIGQPDGSDFGDTAGSVDPVTGKYVDRISQATYDFFARYIAMYPNDDAIQAQYGDAPTRRATFGGADPNSPAGQQATQAAGQAASAKATAESNERIAVGDRAHDAAEGVLDRGVTVSEGALNRGSAMDIAKLQDATDRWIAEGDWGTQKYVAELQEKGLLERLKIDIAFKEKDLVFRAKEAKDKHHVAMVGLALEVAKFDAELGQEPRNWLAYASWLQNRDMVVDGLNLAMAADMVTEDVAASEAAATGSPVGQVAAQMSVSTQQKQMKQQKTGGQGQGQQQAQGAPQVQQAAAGAAGQYQVGNYNLDSTDYAGLARQLMGSAPGAQTQVPTTQQLQAAYDSTETVQDRGGYGAWGGPTTTNQGVRVNASGQQENYTNFKNLLPVQQEMRLGAVQGVRGKFGVNDFLAEMERSRPKGSTSGVASLG